MVDYGWGPVQSGQTSQQPVAYAPSSSPSPKTEPAAVLAVIAAFAGILSWGITSVFALILAGAAKRSIDASNGTRKGNNLVLTARIASIVMIIGAIATLAVLAG